MKEWKVIKNKTDKKETVTAGGNIYEFNMGEMKIVPADDAKFIVEKYIYGPLGDAKFEFISGKDIPQEFINKMISSSDNTKVLINKEFDKFEMTYGGIKYIFKKDCKVVLDSNLANILKERSYIGKIKKYVLEYIDIEKKAEAPKIEDAKEEIAKEPIQENPKDAKKGKNKK